MTADAEAGTARTEGSAARPSRKPPGQPIDRKSRLRIPPHHVTKQTPFERIHNWDEVYYGYTPEPAMFEAQRCIQCPAAPCIKACPVSNDIPGALLLLEVGRIAEAAAVFRATSEMPELCGRLCPQENLCEGHCVVGKNAKPVAIGKLEAFIADWDRKQRGGFPIPSPVAESGARVAIVGSGPAGLTMAETLRDAGHGVSVFESWPKAGGVLRYGIPNFKSAKSIVDAKVAALVQGGVEFRTGVTLGSDIPWEALREYDAVFLAHGAGLGRQLRLEGEELEHVYGASDFLVRANLPADDLPPGQQQKPFVGSNVVVVGGGDTSMDCVRSAVRLGAEQVTLLYRRSANEMAGREEERRHAGEEGVHFEYLTTPVKLLSRDGAVSGIECVHMELGEPDESGRRRPSPIAGSNFVIDADAVAVAVGYEVDALPLGPDSGVIVDDWGQVVTDEAGRTSEPGVFAGGDNVNGADLVVTALASAHQAVPTMLAYLSEVLAERTRAAG